MRAFATVLACTATASAFMLPTPTSRPSTARFSASGAGPKDIVDTAVAAGSFKTLATALTAAGLIDTLKGPGPFTVFAPTDEAFGKIDPATLNAILADKAKLTSILTYHVVSGRVPAAEVLKLSSAMTVQGSTVAVAVSSSGVKVNNANVVATDVQASNGIIHVIDTVLLPGSVGAPSGAKQVDKKSLAYREVMEAGATAPFGFFDPLGLSTGKTFKELKKWRESEVKHGRVAMLAVVGVLLQEVFAPFYNPETGSTDPGPAIFHFQELEALNPFLFVFLILGIAVVESFTISKGWESPEEMRAGGNTIAGLRDTYISGDLEFDPLGLAPTSDANAFINRRSKELNNGRLAMLAWAGMVVQELATNSKIFS